MEEDKHFMDELVGKVVWITTSGGLGTKDASTGNYKGVLLGFDGQFIKLEYEIKKFIEGSSVVSKGIIAINAMYVMTIEEYKESLNI